MVEPARGRTITFYSFKGGTGRSMALANIAWILAQQNPKNRVLIIDWDLEAPGLHRYFRPYIRLNGGADRDSEISQRSGLIDLFVDLRNSISQDAENLEPETITARYLARFNLEEYLLSTDLPNLSLMKAGRFDNAYSTKINTFNWEELYSRQPFLFSSFAQHLSRQYEFVLIDSRTGLTDISSICTMLLPDSLVSVFTPNRQSLEGVIDIASRSAKYRLKSDDLRSFRIFPLVSRVETSEFQLNESWRFGSSSKDIEGYQPQFEKLFSEIYGLSNCDLTSYFDQAQIQYVPYYAFGEKIAAPLGTSGTLSLGRSYSAFTDILCKTSPVCDSVHITKIKESDGSKPTSITWDEQWSSEQTGKARIGLQNSGSNAGMEVRFSLSTKVYASRRQLREIARRAGITTFGNAPIGLFRESDELSPQPSSDGITAEGIAGRSYNFWSIRHDGDFFALKSFNEDGEPEKMKSHYAAHKPVLFSDVRISQIMMVLLYCQRLYEAFDVSLRSEVRVRIEHFGLINRFLDSYGPGHLYASNKPSSVDASVHSETIVLGRIESDLVELVKQFAEPLFELFDFAHFDDFEYQQIIGELQSRYFV